jgi:hypothetical protein
MSGPKASELYQTNPEASEKENSRPLNSYQASMISVRNRSNLMIAS